MRLSTRFRVFWAGLTRGGPNGFAVVRLMHRRFHGNGSKIIGWYKGCPTFTLMAPPTFSSPVRVDTGQSYRGPCALPFIPNGGCTCEGVRVPARCRPPCCYALVGAIRIHG